MSSDSSRARRLGDLGANDPACWRWGGRQEDVPHLLVMLYAEHGALDAWLQTVLAQCAAGFEQMARLSTSDMDGFEPFGFRDGISQPRIDWECERAAHDQEQFEYTNLSCLGEYLLGYPNEYGAYTDRPLLDRARDPAALLPRAEDAADKADLGRNGSYLVIRQLQQDVEGFWRFIDSQAQGDAALRKSLAEAMVGRTARGRAAGGAGGRRPAQWLHLRRRCGRPALPLRCAHPPQQSAQCRSAARWPDPISRLVRRLGFGSNALRRDLIASTRFHRLLRRGREYGGAPGEDVGLHFICLGANIARQFEFVQGAWLTGTQFDALAGEGDPLLGHRLPGADGTPTDGFSMPAASGPDRRLTGLPQFVTVQGGAYFFLPGIRALRFLSKVQP
jgi:deferrochelatase/peroxidase EfeB